MILTTAGGILPFGFGRKTEAIPGEITVPGRQIIADRVSILRTQPVTVGHGTVPPNTHHRMVFFMIKNSECAAIPADPTV
jgi:hypothetical protein